MINIKNENDIEKIREAALVWKQTRDKIIEATKPGVRLIDLNNLAKSTIENCGGICSFYKCYDFPKHICISVNEQLIHGVPDEYILKNNDLVTFDIGVTLNNYVCDAAFTILVNPATDELKKKINKATHQTLMEAIKIIRPGIHLGDIEATIEKTAQQFGYEVIKDFSGHGCGLAVHEDPTIRNYGEFGTGIKLVPGMILCLEPMLMTDSDNYVVDQKNKWTVSSLNKKLTCHWEHMVLVTKDGHEILTE